MNEDDEEELKKELKEISKKIAALSKQKSELANELAKCQDSMRKGTQPNLIKNVSN